MNKLAMQLIVAAVLCGGFTWYTVHQQNIGEARIKAKDAELVAAKKISNAEVERRAEVIAAKSIGEYKAQLAAPPAADAPSLKCPRLRPAQDERSAGAVSNDIGARSTDHAVAAKPEMVSRESEGYDYGPEIDKRFADADKLIETLQAHIRLEEGICRPKRLQ